MPLPLETLVFGLPVVERPSKTFRPFSIERNFSTVVKNLLITAVSQDNGLKSIATESIVSIFWNNDFALHETFRPLSAQDGDVLANSCMKNRQLT
jgi:hypothetical protein